MIHLTQIDSVILLRLNRRLFEDPEFQYDAPSMAGFDPEEETRRRIGRVKKAKRDRILAASPPCPERDATGFQDWWAQWMPIATGRQIWPDGNHRTAMMLAENIAELAGFTMVLDADDVEEMRRESKAIIASMWGAKGKNRYVTEAELVATDSPLRRFYEGFKDRIRLERLPDPAE